MQDALDAAGSIELIEFNDLIDQGLYLLLIGEEQAAQEYLACGLFQSLPGTYGDPVLIGTGPLTANSIFRLKIGNALGRQGSVYLRIPAQGEGRGKITIEIQGRSVELAAVTDGDAIKTGAIVQVVEVLGDETVKVQTV